MTAPEMAGWNLALRFGLEIAALVGLAAGAWAVSTGWVRWVAVVVVSLGAATIWGTFNVVGDPSRSGEAPVEVAGWIRLLIELFVLAAGVAGFVLADRPLVAGVLAVLVIFHYATSVSRIRWLLER